MSATDVGQPARDSVLSRESVMSGAEWPARMDAVASRPSRHAQNARPVTGPPENLRQSPKQPKSGITVDVTVPAGLSSQEIVALLKRTAGLKGRLDETPPEGSLLPGTYAVLTGSTRLSVLRRMQRAMGTAVSDIWANRSPRLALKSPSEAVTLASIIDREAMAADEMPLIASVFLNRLSRGMRLEADPTVIFALTGGPARLGRPLTRADLRTPSRFNTYLNDGLPPAPIGNPGRAALRAAVNPAQSDFLYFVADGKGRHSFSVSLDAHEAKAQAWRATRDARLAAAADRAVSADAKRTSSNDADARLAQQGATPGLPAPGTVGVVEGRIVSSDPAGQAAPAQAMPAAESTFGRDPFAVTPRLTRVSTGGLQQLQFVPSSAKPRKLPKMKLRGLMHAGVGKDAAAKKVAALLEIQGSGVFVVRAGDTIGLHEIGLDTVLKIVKVDTRSVVVETGSLGQVIIVR